MWVRGLKQIAVFKYRNGISSHPMWVRGLKPKYERQRLNVGHVAPYVGAWIETLLVNLTLALLRSHPMWVRGLKQEHSRFVGCWKTSHPMWVRGLKHNVVETARYALVSHPMWVRGLKHGRSTRIYRHTCRTLCGCVDWNRVWVRCRRPH